MRLHHSLDPKRFYRGGAGVGVGGKKGKGKAGGEAEFFQLGHVVDSGMAPTNEKVGAVKKRSLYVACLRFL